MDFPQAYVGHQMHDQQDSPYNGGPGHLEGRHHQVDKHPFQANVSGSISSWTPHRNINDNPPHQTTDPRQSEHDEMGFGPNFEPQGMDLQPMWLPPADAVAPMPQAPMPQVDDRSIAAYMTHSREQLKKYCDQRDIKTSRTRTHGEFVELAQLNLPGTDCFALSKSEIRRRCKDNNVATPDNRQRDSKAVMAQKLVEDDARWGL